VTFDLTTILIFSVAALIYSALLPARWREWTLLAGGVVCVYWLQPNLPVRYLDFALPTATLIIIIAVWWFIHTSDRPQEDRVTLAAAAALTIAMALMRYIERQYRITASRPPPLLIVIAALVIVGFVILAIWWLVRRRDQRRVLTGVIVVLVGIFAVMKTEALAAGLSRILRAQTGQDTGLANPLDLTWLGFSYIAFRLIHMLRDRQSGKLPALSLREFLTYVTFFPALTAGPIDRAERFVKDFHALPEMTGLDASRIIDGATRIMVGIFKKFVIADSLALIALNTVNAEQAQSAWGMWLLLYGYAFRLFLDFSGYSDIAIGIGLMFGVRLPENFDYPYLKNNMTAFWQSWHMTLSNWARFYVFSPLSRTLLMRQRKPPAVVVVFITQMATMLVIGLWHGVTWNFIIWGVWHGVGLFVHKQWSDRTRQWYRELTAGKRRAWTLAGWFITFHYVVIGWAWFALPDIDQSLRVFGRLFGVG
jgi:alginate O-acetyltransferase complex protein AlgI